MNEISLAAGQSIKRSETITLLTWHVSILKGKNRILIAIEIQSMLCMRYDDDKEIKLCHWVLLYVQFLVLNPLFPQIGYLMTKTTRMTNFWFFFQSRIFTRQYMHSTFFTTHHFYLYAAGFVNILLQQRVWTKQYSNGSLDPTMSFSYNG